MTSSKHGQLVCRRYPEASLHGHETRDGFAFGREGDLVEEGAWRARGGREEDERRARGGRGEDAWTARGGLRGRRAEGAGRARGGREEGE